MLTIINFKAYRNSTGANAIKLAKICSKFKNVAIAVQPADIHATARCKLPVLAQHVDLIEYGAKTGWILPESCQQMGAIGSLVNHSEHRIPMQQIKKTIERLRKLKMISIACAATPKEAVQIAKFKPDVIAIEPPELIGGNISVSEAKPEVITKTTHKIKTPVLCGAGVHTRKDVQHAIKLGAKGILVAHAITNAKNPGKALKELVNLK
ncbi:triose-phosphate isomerase [Candidatus Woesearchaeota archaeon]|nr:triose-phosphate isomerase [Candidatus Woesearchaeota archaeon]